MLALAQASEGQVWLDLNVTGDHSRDYWWYEKEDGTKVKQEYNEQNFGVGLSYGVNDYIDILGGTVFKNSYKKTSYYFGSNIKYPINLFSDTRLELGVMVAAATGYEGTIDEKSTVGGLLPYVIPNITLIAEDTFYARLGWCPDLDGKSDEEYPVGDRVQIITLQFGVLLHPYNIF
jgi:hypothetical protein